MTSGTRQGEGMYSALAEDPDMAELVELFVEELPQRLATLQAALAACDLPALGRGAHQLKGAVGSYGFDRLTTPFQLLEKRVREQAPPEELEQLLSDVTELCRLVRSGSPT